MNLVRCKKCFGEGHVEVPSEDQGTGEEEFQKCEGCDGVGYVEINKH